jgi:hypothetical protein
MLASHPSGLPKLPPPAVGITCTHSSPREMLALSSSLQLGPAGSLPLPVFRVRACTISQGSTCGKAQSRSSVWSTVIILVQAVSLSLQDPLKVTWGWKQLLLHCCHWVERAQGERGQAVWIWARGTVTPMEGAHRPHPQTSGSAWSSTSNRKAQPRGQHCKQKAHLAPSSPPHLPTPPLPSPSPYHISWVLLVAGDRTSPGPGLWGPLLAQASSKPGLHNMVTRPSHSFSHHLGALLEVVCSKKPRAVIKTAGPDIGQAMALGTLKPLCMSPATSMALLSSLPTSSI